MKMESVLKFAYLDDFKCIGSQCEDHCCGIWQIGLNKQEYEKYKDLKVGNLELKDLISRFDYKDRSDSRYGLMGLLKENKNCPLLREDKLCGLQIEHGFDSLSNTCKVYPRNLTSIDGRLEMSATLSCPEVARKVIFREEGLLLINGVEDINNRRNFTFNSEKTKKRFAKYFWDIRVFSLNLLQNRSFTIEERLILLGMVYDKIMEIKQGEDYLVIGLLHKFNQVFESEDIKLMLNNLPSNLEPKMNVLQVILNYKVNNLNQPVYVECLNEIIMGFLFRDGMKTKADIYKYNRDEFYQPYMENKDYIYENFLVNEFFRNRKPFDTRDIWESYINLVVLYSVVKIGLVGISGYYGELNNKLLVKYIYSFARQQIHDGKYIEKVNRFLRSEGLSSYAHMVMLIKD